MPSLLAEVVPEAPGIGALLLFLVAFGLSYIAAPLVRLILGGASGLIGKIPIVGGIVSAPIRKAEDRTVKWLLNKAAAMQGVGVAMFRLWWNQHRRLVAEVADLAHDTFYGLVHLNNRVRADVYRLIRDAGGKVKAVVVSGGATVTASVAAQRRWVRAQLRSLSHSIDAKIAHAIDVAIPGTISIPRPRLGYLERVYRGLREQVRRHSKLLTAAGITALVLAALKRMRLGFLRCSKVGRAGRRICGMDENLLTSLLVDTLYLASTFSIVELAKACGEFANDVDDAVRFVIKEAPNPPTTG